MIVNDDIELRLRKIIKVVTVDSTWSRAVPFKWNTHTLRINNIIIIFVIYARIWKGTRNLSSLFPVSVLCVFLKASYAFTGENNPATLKIFVRLLTYKSHHIWLVIHQFYASILKNKWDFPHANNIAKMGSSCERVKYPP